MKERLIHIHNGTTVLGIIITCSINQVKKLALALSMFPEARSAIIGCFVRLTRENFQFEPDIKTTNDYKSVAEGKDNQLEGTVKLLLK